MRRLSIITGAMPVFVWAVMGTAYAFAATKSEAEARILAHVKGRPVETQNPRDILENRPDFVCFVPRNSRKFQGRDDGDPNLRGDAYNDHFQVIADERRRLLHAFWTQASYESAPDQHIAYSRSADNGETWSDPVILAGSETRKESKPLASWQQPMLTKSGRLYCLWNQQTTRKPPHWGWPYGRYSDDGGKTWSEPEALANFERMDQDGPDAAVPPCWCNWQRPLRLAEGGRFFVGCSRHGTAPYDAAHCSKTEFWRFENMDDDPPVRDIRISHFAKNRASLATQDVVPVQGHPFFAGGGRLENGKLDYHALEEASVVKLPDGRLFALMRSTLGCPVWTQSRDGGETWARPRALLDADGKPFLHPCSPCPIYDWKGCEAASGIYFTLLHCRFDFKDKTARQKRGPLYLVTGRFDPAGEQPITFAKPRLFSTRQVRNSSYASYTVVNGRGVLWTPDQKFYLIGRIIGPEWFTRTAEEEDEDAAIAQKGTHPEFVAKVKAGKFRRARASWWGWNGEDDTAAIQSAIDSDVKTLLIDHMDGPWTVRPIKAALRNRTVVFEDGVTLLAKRGEFRELRDSLLDLSGSTNAVLSGAGATLRMWKADYRKPPYVKSDWRYALCVLDCRNVRVEGFRIEESGGDGIVVARRAKDIVIRNIVSARNYRQGISVIDAENLLIEDCDLIDTSGTPPSAGIDFEPDGGNEKLKGIVMRRCRLEGNAGAGVQVCLNQQSDRSAPVSILIEDCRMASNDCGTVVIMNRSGNYPTGEVRYRRCTFADARGPGIRFEKKPAAGTAVVFEDCAIEGACTKDPDKPDVLFTPIQWNEELPGGIDFGRLTIRQSKARPWIGVGRRNFAGAPKMLRGRVELLPAKANPEIIQLDDAWAEKTFPLPPEPRPVPQFVGDFRKVRLVDETPEKRVELPPVRAWTTTFYRYYVNRPRRIAFVMHQEPPPDRPLPHHHIWTSQIYGKFRTILQSPGTNATEVAFDAPAAGWYMMGVMPPYGSYFALDAADVPIAISTHYGAPMCRVVGEKASMWFDVPPGRKAFSLVMSGSANQCVKVDVFDPSGKRRFGHPKVNAWTAINSEGILEPGLWRVDFSRPEGAPFWFFRHDISGVPGYFFLSPGKCWSLPVEYLP